MKIQIERDVLIGAVKKVGMVNTTVFTLSSSGKKINEGVLATLEACDTKVKVAISFYISHATKEPFFVLLGGDFISAVVAMSEFGKPYVLDLKDTEVVLTSGSAVVRCNILSEKGVDIAPISDNTTLCLRVATKDLKSMVAKGGYCISTQDAHPFKNAVNFGLVKGKEDRLALFLSSSDGYAACGAFTKASVEGKVEAREELVTLSASHLNALVHLLDGEQVVLFLNKSQVVVRCGNDFYIFRTLEKGYPPHMMQAFYQESFVARVSVDRKELLTAIAVASLDTTSPAISFAKEEGLKVSDVLGKNKVTVTLKEPTEFEELGMNPVFLKRGLGKLGVEQVTLGINSPKTPVYLIGARDEVAFVMPVTLAEAKEQLG